MNIDLNKNRKFQYRLSLSSSLIFLLFLTTFLFNHTIISQTVMAIYVVYGVLCLIMQRKAIKVGCVAIWLFMFSLLGYLQIAYNQTVSKDTTQELANTVMLNGVIFFIFYNILLIKKQAISNSLRLFVIACFISSLFMLLYSASIGSLFRGRLLEDTSVRILFIDMQYNTNSISTLSCLSIAIIWFSDKLFVKRSKIAFTAVFVLTIILSGSRRSFGGLVLVVIFYFLCSRRKRKGWNTVLITVLLSGLFIIVVYNDSINSILGTRIFDLIDYVLTGNTSDSSLNTRFSYVEIGMRLFRERPITGYGIGCFRIAGNTAYYSHNDYIELLSGAGVIGCMVIYCPKLLALKQLLSTRRLSTHNHLYQLSLIILLLIFYNALGNVSYYKREEWYLLTIIVANYKWINNEVRKLSYETHATNL